MLSLADILVVEDDQAIAGFIFEVLSEEGYNVRTATNSEECFAAILDRHPDLVLLDLHLPGKNGDMIVRELRSHGLTNVPMAIMTADTRAAHELSAEEFTFCLTKPFDLADLLDCVAQHVQRSSNTDSQKISPS